MLYIRKILRHVLGATWFKRKVFLVGSKDDIFVKVCYLNLVVLPQGVRGYFMDLVLPPCGWSTGLRATPRTFGFSPNVRQNPLFVQRVLRLSLSAD